MCMIHYVYLHTYWYTPSDCPGMSRQTGVLYKLLKIGQMRHSPQNDFEGFEDISTKLTQSILFRIYSY